MLALLISRRFHCPSFSFPDYHHHYCVPFAPLLGPCVATIDTTEAPGFLVA